jgi:hypothetical protein
MSEEVDHKGFRKSVLCVRQKATNPYIKGVGRIAMSIYPESLGPCNASLKQRCF